MYVGRRLFARLLSFAIFFAVTLALGAGCDRPDQIDIPPLTSREAGNINTQDGGQGPDYLVPLGKRACNGDPDCDDGIACTADKCLVEGYCANTPDWTPCDDGVFCNGLERCDPTAGCVTAATDPCDDDDPCTLDQCDEESRRCRHLPRDEDVDGEVDWHCIGGTDCDDYDAMRGSRMREICRDNVDNNCDGQTDEEDCVSLPHDRCEDALVITESGIYTLSIRGAALDYDVSCNKYGGPDLVLKLILNEAHDVRIRASAFGSEGFPDSAAVAIAKSCQGLAGEINCGSGFPTAEVRARALGPGAYYLMVAILVFGGDYRVDVDLELSEATAVPVNTNCQNPLDISAGGAYHGDFLGAGDDLSLACGVGALYAKQHPSEPIRSIDDLVYHFTTSSEQDVEISLVNQSDEPMAYELRAACDDPGSALRCISGNPATGTFHQLPAGSYDLVVEGPSEREVDFDLFISFRDPTPPPLGDNCDNPAPLVLGEVQRGSLADKQDEISLTCSVSARDMVYRIEVQEPTDILLRVDGEDFDMILDVQEQCGVEQHTDSCVQCQPAVKRLRNLQPGTYYAVVESRVDTNFLIIAEPLPVTVPTSVSANESCDEAAVVPSEGRLFTGTTAGMGDDYQPSCLGIGGGGPDAVFKLELAETKRVVATLEATFDSLLFRLTDQGQEQGVCNPPIPDNCDNSGLYCSSSYLDEILEPGVYYFIVDSYSLTQQGLYYFDVQVTDP